MWRKTDWFFFLTKILTSSSISITKFKTRLWIVVHYIERINIEMLYPYVPRIPCLRQLRHTCIYIYIFFFFKILFTVLPSILDFLTQVYINGIPGQWERLALALLPFPRIKHLSNLDGYIGKTHDFLLNNVLTSIKKYYALY